VTAGVITPIELEEAVLKLTGLRSRWPPPWDIDDLARRFGALIRSSSCMVRQLGDLGVLTRNDGGLWNLTHDGVDVLDAVNSGDWYPLIMLALRSGHFERDLLRFLGLAELRGEEARLAIARARSLCPMLSGVLSWNPEWRRGASLVIPVEVLRRALVEIPVSLAPDGDGSSSRSRDGYASRAVAYSLRLERKRHGVETVLYVVDEERDELGYDLEDISVEPSRLIRCVGTGTREREWLLSLPPANREVGYETHYWGEINLDRPPRDEYLALRRMGYPLVRNKG
jgi:hypothetical protein